MCSVDDMHRDSVYMLACVWSPPLHIYAHTRECIHVHECANTQGAAMWRGLELEVGSAG